MTNKHIPLVDLRAQYDTIKSEIDEAIRSVVENTAFIGGASVDEFGEKFAEAVEAEYCIPVANGTDAIYIVLKMLGIGAGDEVITVANSWISTSETISQTGATPVFVDIDDYFHLDVGLLEGSITNRTKAIVPVHLYGQPADMAPISNICAKHGLSLVEDCAQAHLASYHNKTVGNFGAAGTFSFYPGKNLGAYGDAGAIVTNDAELARNCRMYANHGGLRKHEHLIEGINSRLDGLQASVLAAKLPYLRGWTEARRKVAEALDLRLSKIEQVQIPRRRPNSTHVFHLYVIRASDRDGLMSHLHSNGVACAVHYPTPLPLLPAYARFGYVESDFPVAIKASQEILSLPIYPEIGAGDIDRICDCIADFYSAN